MRKTSIYGLLAAGFVTMLTACAKTEVFDATQYENSQKDAYAANFIKKYGDINPNQTWDFTKGPQLGTRSGDSEGISVELIAGLDFGIEEGIGEDGKYAYTFTKNQAIYNDVPLKLPDKVKHTGESSMLVAPSNDFYIYPISCQGQWTHDLYVKVGDADPVKVYHKFWTDCTKPYVNGMATSTTIKNGELTVNKRSDMPGVHITAPVGTPVEVYLDKINNGAATSASTATGCAIVINTDVKPEGVPLKDNSVVQYIGMEDRYDYDFDYNDMVMVMVGNPDTPPTIKIENDNYDVKTNITKRYMIEDLGATDDFDFNDIVVDVTENTTVRHRVTYEVGANGERGNLIKDVVYATNKSQKATICHLGGILPFTLKVGNTDFGEMDGQLDKDVKIEKNISGWDPDKNNVSISVKQKNGAYYEIKFPKAGDVPMIIAVDPSQKWMPERKSVPKDWFYIP
jgi:hypothetical protein